LSPAAATSAVKGADTIDSRPGFMTAPEKIRLKTHFVGDECVAFRDPRRAKRLIQRGCADIRAIVERCVDDALRARLDLIVGRVIFDVSKDYPELNIGTRVEEILTWVQLSFQKSKKASQRTMIADRLATLERGDNRHTSIEAPSASTRRATAQSRRAGRDDEPWREKPKPVTLRDCAFQGVSRQAKRAYARGNRAYGVRF
jgi:hypothetical protein